MINVVWKSEDEMTVVLKKKEKFRVLSSRKLKLNNGDYLLIWRMILETENIDKAIMTARSVKRMVRYMAEIRYTIDKDHPVYKYLPDSEKTKELCYDDVYSFIDNTYSEEAIIDYIKHDLRLVAGSVHNIKHIHNVKFNIKKI